MKVRLIKSFTFDAAHELPCFGPEHKCARLHGHTFRIDVILEGPLPEGQDYLTDFGDISAAVEPLRKQLDHNLLNEATGLASPTSERLAVWLWQRLKPALPLLSMIRIHETPTCICEYEGA